MMRKSFAALAAASSLFLFAALPAAATTDPFGAFTQRSAGEAATMSPEWFFIPGTGDAVILADATAEPLTSVVAAPASSDAVHVGKLYGFFLDYLLPAFGTLVTALLAWVAMKFKTWTGLQIEAAYVDDLAKAVTDAAGQFLARYDSLKAADIHVGNTLIASLANWVIDAAPEAVKKLGWSEGEVRELIVGKIGQLTATQSAPPAAT